MENTGQMIDLFEGQAGSTQRLIRSWCSNTTNGLTPATGQELGRSLSRVGTTSLLFFDATPANPAPHVKSRRGRSNRTVTKTVVCVTLLLSLALGFLWKQSGSQENLRTRIRRPLYYVDPMHPAYRSDRPGIAPDCNMRLEPVYGDEGGKATMAETAEVAPAAVSIDASKQQLLGIGVAVVERGSQTRTLRVPGKVAVDEGRIYRIDAAVDGLVKGTLQDTVGSAVKKGQPLAVVYSHEFVSTAGGYLSAKGRLQDGASASGTQSLAEVQSWADRLRNLGMSEVQITEISVTRKIPDGVYIVSPEDGFVVARNVSPGMRFDRNMEFYRIADLSHVWIVADLLGEEDQFVRPGAVAHVTLRHGSRNFVARVSDILPQVDSATRAVRVRLQADNQNFVLRPEMLVNVDFAVSAPSGLSVPADAVVDSGLSHRVYVERSNGIFEPRQVEIGQQFGDRIQILRGLAEGERVVASGTFLVDSESRLKPTNLSAGWSDHFQE